MNYYYLLGSGDEAKNNVECHSLKTKFKKWNGQLGTECLGTTFNLPSQII